MLNLRAPEFRQNPYPFYKHMRKTAPVCRIEPHGFWAVFRHCDVIHVLKNPELFSSAGINEEPESRGPDLMLSTRGLLAHDRPSHTRLRKRLGKAFPVDVLHALQPFIEASVQVLLTDISNNHSFDVVKDFANHLPIMVICHLLGLDPERKADIKRWSDTMLSWRMVASNQEKARQVKAQMIDFYAFVVDALEQKKRKPQDDIISRLLQTSSKDDELSLEEILSFVRLILVAGTDTTTHLLGNTILAFINYPELYRSIKEKPALISQLVEESLRFDSPVQCVMRRAAVDIELADICIPKNDLVLACIASANHDEQVYHEPHRFVATRIPQQHLTFGAGIHVCMGAQIARLQARIALEQFVCAFDQCKRADNVHLDYFNSIFFRGLTTLAISGK